MNPGCTTQRDALIFALSENQLIEPALREHLDACAECRLLEERTRLSLRALEVLPRESAPSDLDGRIVAALNAGFREDRAARSLDALTRLVAPRELAETISNSESVDQDLRARVEREMAHPELVIGERLARIATRHTAPAELEHRLAADLAGGTRRAGWRPSRMMTSFALAAAASFVVWLSLDSRAPVRPDLNSISFRIREVKSVTELDPMARLMMGAVTGGGSDVREF